MATTPYYLPGQVIGTTCPQINEKPRISFKASHLNIPEAGNLPSEGMKDKP